MLAEVLTQFVAVAGVEQGLLRGAETPSKLTLTKVAAASNFASISGTHVDTLLRSFGNSLNLTVGLDTSAGVGQFVRIENGILVGNLDDGLAKLKGRPATTDIRLELGLDKTALLRHLSLLADGRNGLFYFFKDNFHRFLAAPLLELDGLLYTARSQPCIVVVSDALDSFDGQLLQVVGETKLSSAADGLSITNQDLLHQLERFYADDPGRPSWVGFRLANLTPLHLAGSWSGSGNEAIEEITTRHLLDLCILYTANRSSYDRQAGTFQAVYANSERTVRLNLVPEVSSHATPEVLGRLANWLSTGRDKDRLTILQNIVARRLESEDPVENYKQLSGILLSVFGEAQWHYRIFTDGQIDKHFEQVQKLNGYISDVTKKIAESLDTVTKGVADTLLATIGVLVLTVLAALIKNEASSSIFTIGMRVYSGYLIFFAVYRMGSVGHSYWLQTRDAEDQLATFNTSLRPEKVNELKKPLDRRRFQFALWFWVTTIIYIVLAGGIWLVGGRAPGYLIEQGLAKPAASSPTPPPSTPTPEAQQQIVPPQSTPAVQMKEEAK